MNGKEIINEYPTITQVIQILKKSSLVYFLPYIFTPYLFNNRLEFAGVHLTLNAYSIFVQTNGLQVNIIIRALSTGTKLGKGKVGP